MIIQTLPEISTEGLTLDDVDMLMERTRKVMCETFESLVTEVNKQWHWTKYVIVPVAVVIVIVVRAHVCVLGRGGGAFVQCNNIQKPLLNGAKL